ncbi:hypothetical protein ACFQH2_08595 [Natronoarchaeum sp. GCM10025703]|uniref:hypothetical protein n=1 Tax=Natronoarchaeum sp. GCM10025703 TaxID=3252685 RepID=UPI003620752F
MSTLSARLPLGDSRRLGVLTGDLLAVIGIVSVGLYQHHGAAGFAARCRRPRRSPHSSSGGSSVRASPVCTEPKY